MAEATMIMVELRQEIDKDEAPGGGWRGRGCAVYLPVTHAAERAAERGDCEEAVAGVRAYFAAFPGLTPDPEGAWRVSAPGGRVRVEFGFLLRGA